MKKFVLLFVLLVYGNSYAGISELFRYDHAKVEKAFLNADLVDNYVQMHHATLKDVKQLSPVVINLLDNSSENINFFDKGPDELFGIPPFWWGFFLNWVGALLVYLLTDHNKEYTKDAIIGFLVSSVLYVGSYFCCWGYGWFVWW